MTLNDMKLVLADLVLENASLKTQLVLLQKENEGLKRVVEAKEEAENKK